MYALGGLLGSLLVFGCVPSSPDPESGFKNYKDVIASSEKDGYTPYWLGREFTAGDLLFTGPHIAERDEIVGGGARSTYAGVVKELDGSVQFELSMYSPQAWELERSRHTGASPAGTVTRMVEVDGHQGTLSLIPAGTRPINAARLVLNIGDTTIVAVGYAGGPAGPGAQM